MENLEGNPKKHFTTAIAGWQRDYNHAEIRGYAHIDAQLNDDGTYTVKYWDRNWKEDPKEFVIISEKKLTKEELLVDIDERNAFIDRTVSRYNEQKAANLSFKETLSAE